MNSLTNLLMKANFAFFKKYGWNYVQMNVKVYRNIDTFRANDSDLVTWKNVALNIIQYYQTIAHEKRK